MARGLLSLALVAAVVLPAARLALGQDASLPPPASAFPSPSAIVPSPVPSFVLASQDEVRDGMFDLGIQTGRMQVGPDEPIDITTTLRYIGAPPRTTVISHGGGPVSFGVEQLDGPIVNGPGYDANAVPFTYRRGDVRDVPFQKSGGWDGSDPMADFWRAWFADPELRLPAGQYRISAYLEYRGLGDQATTQTLEASVVIEVIDSATASPIGSPVPSSQPTSQPTIELWSPIDLGLLPWPYACWAGRSRPGRCRQIELA